jgi:hypothetical protein
MRRIFVPFAVLLAIAAAYSGYWFYIAAKLRSGVTPWAEARRAEGYTLRWDDLRVDGFPAAFRLHFQHPSIAGSRPVPFTATGDTLIGEARPWDLRDWHVTAPAGAHIAAPNHGDGFTAGTLEGSLLLGPTRPTRLDLDARDIAGNSIAGVLHIAEADAHITLPEQRPVDHRGTAASATLHLSGIELPQPLPPPFGRTIDAVALTGTFKGVLPSGPLRDALAAWRDDGGTVDITDSSLHWGDLMVTATGTLALDDALQPVGALTAKIEGQDAIVDAVVAGGGLQPGDAHFAKVFLGLMAKAGADGRRRLTLPLRLQDDRAYLGPAQIAALPRFTWE